MEKVFASLIFFTRMPWWRLHSPAKEAFEHVVDFWPFVGWFTGGTMALVLWCATLMGCPLTTAALLAISVRLLLTGALHEDGLADFCDGFGGGTSREKTLEIMKDSHIGTYGVLGLCLYLAMLWTCMITMPVAVILLFDVAAKCAASLITGQLPYARTAETAKNGVVYAGRSWQGWLLHSVRCALALSLPLAICAYAGVGCATVLLPIPFAAQLLLMLWIKHRIGGYTGDCCGAMFLLSELSLYLAWQFFF